MTKTHYIQYCRYREKHEKVDILEEKGKVVVCLRLVSRAEEEHTLEGKKKKKKMKPQTQWRR